MTDQPALFDDRPDWMRTPKGEQFLAWHEANPWVFEKMCDLAREYQAANTSERCSTKMLMERLRWEALTAADLIALGGAPVLNNVWTPYLARLMMMRPEFEGMFELRALRSAA